MPYIDQTARIPLDMRMSEPLTPGELSYAITRLLLEFDAGASGYAAYALLVGVLETCKLELYRRLIAPYEDQKIQENGDVYDDPPPMQ